VQANTDSSPGAIRAGDPGKVLGQNLWCSVNLEAQCTHFLGGLLPPQVPPWGLLLLTEASMASGLTAGWLELSSGHVAIEMDGACDYVHL
jgi:hypothetical protein